MSNNPYQARASTEPLLNSQKTGGANPYAAGGKPAPSNARDTGGLDSSTIPHSRDPTFQGVRLDGRSTQDIVFAILFGLVVGAMLIISIIAYNKGHPDKLVQADNLAQAQGIGKDWLQHQYAQIKKDSDVLGISLIVVIIYGVVWIELMRRFSKALVYATLAAGLTMVLVFAIQCVSSGKRTGNQSLVIMGIILFVAFLLLAFFVFFLRQKIALTCVMMQEAMAGVQAYPSVFVVSGVAVVLFVLFVVYWATSMVHVFSVPKTGDKTDPNTVMFDDHIRQVQYFMIFGFFWVTTTLSALLQYTVAGGVASWYFTRGTVLPYHPVWRSLGNALTSSFGTICFGSLVLSVVKFANYLIDEAKKDSKASRYLLCCLSCLCKCLEGIVKFVNRFAFVYAAMYGDSFCKSGKNVMGLLGRNGITTIVLDTITQWVLFFGKILGVLVTSAIALEYLQHTRDHTVAFSTMGLVAVGAYVLLALMSHVIGQGVDTVFVCYVEDVERNAEAGEMKACAEMQSMCVERIEASAALNKK